MICVVTVVASIRVTLVYWFGGLDEFGQEKSDFKRPKVDVVEQIKSTYDLNVKYTRERSVKIYQLWLYPVRGIQGMLVN